MDALKLYDRVCAECSVLTTKAYSTSFSLGIRFLGKPLRAPIYSIYGYVRFADEIVDTFHHADKAELFNRFKKDTDLAIQEKISLNPILHAFQQVYHQYSLDKKHVDLFLQSMEWDLKRADYDRMGFEQYIVGSAEVVGLMCLKVFVNGDQQEYERELSSLIASTEPKVRSRRQSMNRVEKANAKNEDPPGSSEAFSSHQYRF